MAVMNTITGLPLVLLIFCFVRRDFVPTTGAHLTTCLDSDREVLLDFKNGLHDPENRLSSWKGSNCCHWLGISCDNGTGAVIAVDLHGAIDSSGWYVFWELGGEIAPSLTKLRSLRHLDLSFNSFNHTPIPEFLGLLKNLQYLNFSYAGFGGSIPPNIGNLSTLQYLDLGGNWGLDVDNVEWVTALVSLKHLVMNGVNLSNVGLEWFGQLNKLSYLAELHLSLCELSGSIPPLTFVNLTSLAVLDLSSNSFHSKIPDCLLNISSLVTLDISANGLFGRIPLGFSDLPNLQFLYLERNNNLTASCHELFGGRWEKIQVLDLSDNSLHGKLPPSIGNMTYLSHLDLAFNNFEGIPSSIGKLCNLIYFDMSNNNMNGSLPDFLEGTENCLSRRPLSSLRYLYLSDSHLVGKLPEWLGHLENLLKLDLFNNSLYGPIPASLGSLQNLRNLKLASNELIGTFPESLGQLSKLGIFNVSSNHLTGVLTETHFLKQEMLDVLDLSSNSFTLNVSSNWVPPFQASEIHLGSCHLGPSFPAWLRSQNEVEILDLSNASISGSLPYWFLEFSHSLSRLKLSFNQLVGQLPSPLKFSSEVRVADFSSNNFSGPIPIHSGSITALDLSKNKLSGNIPSNISDSLRFLSIAYNQINGEIPASIDEIFPNIRVFDFSNNNLTGNIPSSIGNCSNLFVLDISNNLLFGTIPTSLGQLTGLQSLHLNGNELYGQFPSSFLNLSSLETLNLGNNKLSGTIPPKIGKVLERLRILSLRSNSFSGELPALMSNLSSLQVLDLAENRLTGTIPASFGDFEAMSKVQIINYQLYHTTKCSRYNRNCRENIGASYSESLVVNMKGQHLIYTTTLSLVIALDLSRNNLSGDVPEELTNLSGLVALDLSRNYFTGRIPKSISKLEQLNSLDLSSNRFSGAIPQSLGKLSFLGYLNLSNNNFSGKIPHADHMLTFDAPSFDGNLGLCGAPLDVKCPGDENDDHHHPYRGWTTSVESDKFIDKWFYLSIGLGFAAGLLLPYLVMAFRKSWSEAYFDTVDRVFDRLQYLGLKYTPKKQRTRPRQQRR